MTSLTVVIPSKNAANLAACVEAIRQAGEMCRIIVVDDGIDWYAYDCVNQREGHELRADAIAAPKGFQFSRNVNMGIRAAGTDDVVICNDDALLQSHGGFSLLQAEQLRHPEFAIIGATTQVTGQPLQFRRPSGGGLRIVPHIAFVCVYIPRSTLNRDDIGYLDERYICGSEDRDYCQAVNAAKMLVGVHDGCYVDHGSLVSTVRGPGGSGYDSKGAETFAAKWGGRTK